LARVLYEGRRELDERLVVRALGWEQRTQQDLVCSIELAMAALDELD
jgi:hypothetical protein